MVEPLLVWDHSLSAYNFGPGHPFDPRRWELTVDLARDLGVLEHYRFRESVVAADADLELVHTPAYVSAVRTAAALHPPGRRLLAAGHGLGSADNPVFPGMHRAAARIAGASILAAREIAAGTAVRAVNVAGGHHHAMPDAAAGFCVYNDAALAVAALLEAGVPRVAYVDVDAHHGDGVQAAFAEDPRVLTVSLHQEPGTLWPGTGFPDETGTGPAAGTVVNVALPAGTDDGGWLRAFDAVVPGVLRAFRPQVLVTQHGVDGHRDDPFSDLAQTVDGQRAVQIRVRDLAVTLTGGRWLALGGGGYEPVRVVPRTWTHLLAVLADADIPPDTVVPSSWTDRVRERYAERQVPGTMGDGAAPAPVPWNGRGETPLDRAILATRSAVYPLWGLDPRDLRD